MSEARRRLTTHGAGLAALLLVSSCAHSIDVPTPTPPALPEVQGTGLPAVLDYVYARLDGTPANVSPQLVELILTRLRKTGLYTSVYEPDVALEAPARAIHLSLELDQSEQVENMASGMLKAVFVIYSLGLLAPVLPYHYSYEVRMVVTVEGEDGGRKYEGAAAGLARYPLIFSSPWKILPETQAKVLGRALDRLAYELIQGGPHGE